MDQWVIMVDNIMEDQASFTIYSTVVHMELKILNQN